METIFAAIVAFVSGITVQQILALLLCIAAFSVAMKSLSMVMSLAMTVIGVLFALYVLSPDLYAEVISWTQTLASSLPLT